MTIDLAALCEKVEACTFSARARAVPEANQIYVTFTNRPDVTVALLTPYLQMQVAKGWIDYEDLADLLKSIRRIANTHFDSELK